MTPCCVIGFPFGTQTPEAKRFEAQDAVTNGAREVDMVINVGAIKSRDWHLVKRDIEGVVEATRGRAGVKVILETCLLTDEEKVKACTVSKLAGAAFVKTSTGYSKGGATVEDVQLMRATVGPRDGRKGIRRNPYLRGRRGHDQGRRQPPGRQRRHQDHRRPLRCLQRPSVHQLRRLQDAVPHRRLHHYQKQLLILTELKQSIPYRAGDLRPAQISCLSL